VSELVATIHHGSQWMDIIHQAEFLDYYEAHLKKVELRLGLPISKDNKNYLIRCYLIRLFLIIHKSSIEEFGK
jgi:hypothetical protein